MWKFVKEKEASHRISYSVRSGLKMGYIRTILMSKSALIFKFTWFHSCRWRSSACLHIPVTRTRIKDNWQKKLSYSLDSKHHKISKIILKFSTFSFHIINDIPLLNFRIWSRNWYWNCQVYHIITKLCWNF